MGGVVSEDVALSLRREKDINEVIHIQLDLLDFHHFSQGRQLL